MLVKKVVYFQVGDHDFTKFSIIPSVVLIIAIPNDITGSWYDGQVAVTLKDAVLSPPLLYDMPLSCLVSFPPLLLHLHQFLFSIQMEARTIVLCTSRCNCRSLPSF